MYVKPVKAAALMCFGTICRAATGPEAPTQSTSAVLGSSKPAEAGIVAEQASPWTYLQKTYSQNRGMELGSHAHTRKAAGKAASQSQLFTKPPPVQEVTTCKACPGKIGMHLHKVYLLRAS